MHILQLYVVSHKKCATLVQMVTIWKDLEQHGSEQYFWS